MSNKRPNLNVVLLLSLFLLYPVVCPGNGDAETDSESGDAPKRGPWEYVLLEGEGTKVCEAYLDNLNAGGKRYRCERAANAPAFSKPEWQPVSVMEHSDLWINVSKFQLEYRIGIPSWNREFRDESEATAWQNMIQREVARGHLALEHTSYDLDSDGVNEWLLRYHEGKCPREGNLHPLILILVYDAITGEIDDIKTIRHLMSTSDADRGSVELLGGVYDLFTYQGKTWFDVWRLDGNVDEHPSVNEERLVVYEVTNEGRGYQCTYGTRADDAQGGNPK